VLELGRPSWPNDVILWKPLIGQNWRNGAPPVQDEKTIKENCKQKRLPFCARKLPAWTADPRVAAGLSLPIPRSCLDGWSSGRCGPLSLLIPRSCLDGWSSGLCGPLSPYTSILPGRLILGSLRAFPYFLPGRLIYGSLQVTHPNLASQNLVFFNCGINMATYTQMWVPPTFLKESSFLSYRLANLTANVSLTII